MPKKRKTETISSILMGDSLAELLQHLSDIEEFPKVIVLQVVAGGRVSVLQSSDVTPLEATGILYKAIETSGEW